MTLNRRSALLTIASLALAGAVWLAYRTAAYQARLSPPAARVARASVENSNSDHAKVRTNAEWKEILTPMQYYVTREKGTEQAFTGEYWNAKMPGVYTCVCCGLPLFSSRTKYDSGTGWPSFYEPYRRENIATELDHGWFATRVEVLCSRCGAHLGHVFEDGPPPTGLRYCMNSAALRIDESLPLEPDDAQESSGGQER